MSLLMPFPCPGMNEGIVFLNLLIFQAPVQIQKTLLTTLGLSSTPELGSTPSGFLA